MGRQLRFYMLPEEEQEFLDFVLQEPTVHILKINSGTPEFVIKRSALVDTPRIPMVLFWNSVFDLDPKDIRRYHYLKYDETLRRHVDAEQSYFTISKSNAPVIEYSRPGILENNKLAEARIWANMRRLEDDHFVAKDPKFVSWYEEIVRWLRKHLKHDKDLAAYVSKPAREWLDNQRT